MGQAEIFSRRCLEIGLCRLQVFQEQREGILALALEDCVDRRMTDKQVANILAYETSDSQDHTWIKTLQPV